MGRRIIYRIEDNSSNRFSEEEWDEVERLQHWYNSEFAWSTGRLAFKPYVVFPNTEDFENLDTPVWEVISKRHQVLRDAGLGERAIIAQMEKDKLLVVKWGGYYDNCLASGFTRVADNEWNAYLTCDFLLKASTLLPSVTISVKDEGKFIKTGCVQLHNASAILPHDVIADDGEAEELFRMQKVFAVVDEGKYNRHPSFRNIIPEFNKLKASERKKLVRNWNWLGYEGNFDAGGDDEKGFDLNSKVRSFGSGE
ncbi:MAG: hypothetical protein NTU47_15475 [Ignavibacteriales bacterium]|nr:hypothetical protein [Ignavibacteriales bacterium]